MKLIRYIAHANKKKIGLIAARDRRLSGFTIVELLVVIVVIGIIAAIAIVSYNGMQRRAVVSMVQSDLSNASKGMLLSHAESGEYPTTLPSTIKSSNGVTLSLATTAGGSSVYTGLTAPQNGLLFYNTCLQLISDGVGQRPSDGNDYISACTVYNKNQIHIDGWNGRNVNTPLSISSLDTYVSSYSGGQKPLFTTEAGNFMNQLVATFQAAGGAFPVTSFWDNWATPTNGGVIKPTMPAPTSTGGGVADPTTFCINATHANHADLQWHVRQGGSPTEGACS